MKDRWPLLAGALMALAVVVLLAWLARGAVLPWEYH